MDAITVTVETCLHEITPRLEAAGAGTDEAKAIADNLIDASLRGHDSHGIVRVPRYVLAAQREHVFFGRSAKIELDADTFALLDGQNGVGQTVGPQATKLGIEKANNHGLAVVALKRAGHLGRIGAYAEMAAKENLASIHFVNVNHSSLVAPFGAAGRRMSTAPVAIGVPQTDQNDPFILDFATSQVAEGKVLMAQKSGKALDQPFLVDPSGAPSTNPEDLYGPVARGSVPDPRAGPGALTAMGLHKGSGLALACELLAGALTGSGPTGPGEQVWNGMLSIYLRSYLFDSDAGKSVADYIAWVRDCPPAEGVDQVLIPGDPERARFADRSGNGFSVPAEVWRNILDLPT